MFVYGLYILSISFFNHQDNGQYTKKKHTHTKHKQNHHIQQNTFTQTKKKKERIRGNVKSLY